MVNEYDMYRPYMPDYPVAPHYPPYTEMGYDNAIYYYPPAMHTQMPYYMNVANYPHNPPIPQMPQNIAETNQSNPLLQQFLDENGQVDIQKMLQTVGQLADTVQQVSPVIKQVNDLIRAFRET